MEAASIRTPVQQPDPTRGELAKLGWTPADPGPLGLAAFALTTFMLSAANAHVLGQVGISASGLGTVPIVLSLALAYGGLTQLLAGLWEFRTGNTFGAVAFSSYGAFWLSFWAFVTFFAADIKDPKQLNHAIGLYLIGWGIFTTYMFVASLRTTSAVALVFLLLAITFWILGFGNYHDSVNTIKIGGWVGLATAAAACYASFAAVVNSTFGRVILPVVALNVART
jgi:succinate-acetate transporter protein